MAVLIPQPHGGAISPRYGGTPAHGSARNGTSFAEVRRRVREIYAMEAENQAKALLELCNSEDERVRIIGVKEFNDRYWGKAGDVVFSRDGESGMLDLTHLTAEQREQLAKALALVHTPNQDGEDKC